MTDRVWDPYILHVGSQQCGCCGPAERLVDLKQRRIDLLTQEVSDLQEIIDLKVLEQQEVAQAVKGLHVRIVRMYGAADPS